MIISRGCKQIDPKLLKTDLKVCFLSVGLILSLLYFVIQIIGGYLDL